LNETIKISTLLEFDQNSRVHPKSQIKQIEISIKEFGFYQSIVIDENNIILAGHARVQAARNIGLYQVPAVRLSNLTEQQKSALVIADNKIASNSGWNKDALMAEMMYLGDSDYDLAVTGFNLGEIKTLFSEEIKDPINLPDKCFHCGSDIKGD
jgi:ParB-like chromosome segregation protein Spo0J